MVPGRKPNPVTFLVAGYATPEVFKKFLVLKGLSHEIDFKNVDEKGKILALIRPRLVFEFFGGSSDF
jgi:hypothetical protein